MFEHHFDTIFERDFWLPLKQLPGLGNIGKSTIRLPGAFRNVSVGSVFVCIVVLLVVRDWCCRGLV